MIGRILFFALLMTSSACVSVDTVKSSQVDFNTIFADYSLYQSGETGQAVTAKLQFRVGGTSGTTVEFDEGEQFLVNGEAVAFYPGSSSFINTEGSYYKHAIALDDVTSTVEIAFVDKNGVSHSEVVNRALPITFTSIADGDTLDITQPQQVNYSPAIDASGSLGWRDLIDNQGNYEDHIIGASGAGTFSFPAQDLTGKNVIAVFLDANVSKSSSVPPNGFMNGSVGSVYQTKTLNLHLP